MFAHIVFFTPKPGLADEERRSFARVFRDSVVRIPSVKRAVVGPAVTTAETYGAKLGLKTYKYAAVLEFDDLAGLVAYLDHDAHRELGAMFWEVCAETAIVDCELVSIEDGLDKLLG